jgi:AcrR family transcriptional regulator
MSADNGTGNAHVPAMGDAEFDRALIAAAFDLAARKGWGRMSIAAAAREAGLKLDQARLRFPGKPALLIRFGRMADQAALASAATEGAPRDRLFDLLMHRFDVLQQNRAGVLALLSALPAEPPTALLLGLATRRSMKWMLEAAGISTSRVLGRLRINAAVAIWLWTLRAWREDKTEDLAHTMAALDKALTRAEQAEGWLGHRPPREPAEAAADEAAPVPPDQPFEPPSETPPPPPVPPG